MPREVQFRHLVKLGAANTQARRHGGQAGLPGELVPREVPHLPQCPPQLYYTQRTTPHSLHSATGEEGNLL